MLNGHPTQDEPSGLGIIFKGPTTSHASANTCAQKFPPEFQKFPTRSQNFPTLSPRLSTLGPNLSDPGPKFSIPGSKIFQVRSHFGSLLWDSSFRGCVPFFPTPVPFFPTPVPLFPTPVPFFPSSLTFFSNSQYKNFILQNQNFPTPNYFFTRLHFFDPVAILSKPTDQTWRPVLGVRPTWPELGPSFFIFFQLPKKTKRNFLKKSRTQIGYNF